MHTVYFGEMPEPRKVTLKQRLEEELVHATRLRPDLRLVAVADAAADNWAYLSALVPEAFQLIDFWHAAQHLGAAAEHIFPQDRTARSMWFKRYRRILRDDPDGAEKVIRSLRYYWTASGRLDAGLESELNYFRNHRNRMNYAKHQAMNGVQIFQSVNRANLPLSRCCVVAGFGIRTPAAPVRGRFAAMLHRSGLTSTRHGM